MVPHEKPNRPALTGYSGRRSRPSAQHG
ncbi:hypothetical protein PLES 10281 [Pseudomonas aeruginosa]|nr:hypothetical protein PLES 10281 [Pseudomonas aeruginosa]